MVIAPDLMTLFDGEGNRGGSGDGDRMFRRRFPGEVGEDTRGREGVVGPAATVGGSLLGGFVGLDLERMGVFWLGANGLLGVTISTASMIILCLTGVSGLGGGAGSSFSSSGSSSSTTVGAFFFTVRDRVVLVVDPEGPGFVLVGRVVARADVLEGGLAEGGLAGGPIEGGFFDGGFTRTACSSTSAGCTPGGLPRRLGATVVPTCVTAVVFLIARFGGAFSTLDGPATALVRVTLASGFFFVGSGGSGTSDS